MDPKRNKAPVWDYSKVTYKDLLDWQAAARAQHTHDIYYDRMSALLYGESPKVISKKARSKYGRRLPKK
jgi:hypothetical protein